MSAHRHVGHLNVLVLGSQDNGRGEVSLPFYIPTNACSCQVNSGLTQGMEHWDPALRKKQNIRLKYARNIAVLSVQQC